MSSKSRQTNYALSTQVLNELKNDGCILDPYRKVYDVDSTDNGGIGDRRKFKEVNEEINKIQNVLKIITGDERAKITEEIPVVDFAHPENIGFDNIYVRNQNGTLDEESIKTLRMESDESEPSSAMGHIERGEEVLNRALLGERSFMGCHLWNSNSVAVDEFNLQVSPYREYDGSHNFTYQGIYSNEGSGFAIDTLDIRPYRTDTIQVICAEGSGSEVFDILLYTNGVPETVTFNYGIFLPKGSNGLENILFAINHDKENNIVTKELKKGFDTIVLYSGVTNVSYGEPFPTEFNTWLGAYSDWFGEYMNIEENYFSKASGLLNGLWSEPYEYNDMGSGYKVTKWKFSNDWIKASKDGVNIPVGSHYYRGCLLNDKRGSIYERPMKITSDEEKSFTFKGESLSGKATYIGTRFLGNDLDAIMLPFKLSSSDWANKKIYKVNEVIKYDDYKDSSSKRKNNVPLRSTSGTFNLENYFNDFNACKSGDTFTLDINNSNIAYRYTKYNAIDNDPFLYGVNAVGDSSGHNVSYTASDTSELYNTGNHFAFMQYIKVLNTNGTAVVEGHHFDKLSLSFKDPYRLLTGTTTTNNVALLYDTPNTHMPTDMWLVSRTNLGIEKYDPSKNGTASLVSFNTIGSTPQNDKVIAFKCTDTKSFIGSEVKKIKIKDDIDSSGYTIDTSLDGWVEYEYNYDPNYNYDGRVTNYSKIYANTIYNDNPMKLEKPMYLYAQFSFYGNTYEFIDALQNPKAWSSEVSEKRMDGVVYQDMVDGGTPDVSFWGGLGEWGKKLGGLLGIKSTTKVCVKMRPWMLFALSGVPNDVYQRVLNEYNAMEAWKGQRHDHNEQRVFRMGPLTATLTYKKAPITLGNVYAYRLAPLTVNTGISFHGQDNETIVLSESNSISLSYPSTYMQFNPNDVTMDIGYPFLDSNTSPNLLLNSNIVVGLPNVSSLVNLNSVSDKNNINGEKGVRMQTLHNLFNSEGGSAVTMWKSTLYNVFKNWRLSNGENPLKFESLLSLIDGIDNLRKTGISVSSLNLAYSKNGNTYRVTDADLNKLWTVLDNRTTVGTYTYSHTPSDITESSTVESILSDEENRMTRDGTSYERRSLMEIAEVVRPILDSNTAPTLDTFKELDEIFGKGGAFLRMGNSEGMKTDSSDIVMAEEEMIDSALSRYLYANWNKDTLGVFSLGKPEESFASYVDYHDRFAGKSSLLAIEISAMALLGWKHLSKGLANRAIDRSRESYVNTNKRTLINTLLGTEDFVSYNDAIHIYAVERAEALASRKGWDSVSFDTDIDLGVLQAIADYLRGKLDGYVDNNGTKLMTDGAKYVKGDEQVEGNKNSLYYMRYLYLNNRLNKTSGALSKASMYLNNRSALTSMGTATTNRYLSYEDYMNVMPISRMTSLTYLPKQKDRMSDEMLFGNFYNTDMLNSIRAGLGKNCSLTCTNCAVAENCIYYDHNKLLDQYLPKVKSIDLFVKDNKLDLIGYEKNGNTYTSPSLTAYVDRGNGSVTLDPTVIQNRHKMYNTIFNVDGIRKYDGVDIPSVSSDLEASLYGDEVDVSEEGISWIVGGRYGTVRRNVIKDYENVRESLEQTLPDKTVLYDTVFVEDEETYVNYTMSTHAYEVSLDYEGDHYEGMTKLMIPNGLKILDEADDDADVYLVSDDTIVDGESITPVVYLNTAYALRRMIRFEVDYDEPYMEARIDDRRLYAKDIAQLAINVAKGDMRDNPIFSNGANDRSGLDQIWMDTYEKKVRDSKGREAWIEIEGRPREETYHNELLCDTESFNRALMLSGKPLSASYINYLRKVSIPMLEEETENGMVRTVRWSKYGNENEVEKKKKTLPLMKTNLRLVVATYDK